MSSKSSKAPRYDSFPLHRVLTNSQIKKCGGIYDIWGKYLKHLFISGDD